MKILITALLLFSITHSAWADDVRSLIEARNTQWADTFNGGDDYLVMWKKGDDGIRYYHVDTWWPS
jgi:hypothetical protein